MNTPTTTSPNLETLHEGLTLEWVHDRRIFIFNIRDASRTAADTWINTLDEILRNWPADKPVLALYDANFDRVVITPYIRSRLSTVVAKYKNVYGRTAVVMPPSFTVTLLQLVFRATGTGKRQRRIFTNRDEAMNWLKAML